LKELDEEHNGKLIGEEEKTQRFRKVLTQGRVWNYITEVVVTLDQRNSPAGVVFWGLLQGMEGEDILEKRE